MRVPVRMLEHSRFRLADARVAEGRRPGRRPRPATSCARRSTAASRRASEGEGGSGDGGIQLLLEFKVDDIVDWLWEELELPDLKPQVGEHAARTTRSCAKGWDRRGCALAARPPPHREGSRQAPRDPGRPDAVHRRRPALPPAQGAPARRRATPSVVLRARRVGSMSAAERKLAKTFFFFALQGLRRQYRQRRRRASSRTPPRRGSSPRASSSRSPASAARTPPARSSSPSSCSTSTTRPRPYNVYLFYASDGENAVEDREPALAALAGLAGRLNHFGYLETRPPTTRFGHTQMRSIVADLKARGAPAGEDIVLRGQGRLARDPPLLRPARPRRTRGERRDGGAERLRGAAGGARARARASTHHAGRLRAGARPLHDGDRGLRPAGAHAALVVRRALHPPAGAADAWGCRGSSR